MTAFEYIAALIWAIGIVGHWRMWHLGYMSVWGPTRAYRVLFTVLTIVAWPVVEALVGFGIDDEGDDELY